jgi:hypothetical protein
MQGCNFEPNLANHRSQLYERSLISLACRLGCLPVIDRSSHNDWKFVAPAIRVLVCIMILERLGASMTVTTTLSPLRPLCHISRAVSGVLNGKGTISKVLTES